MNLNPIQNMLLGIAIGDAFGAGYEFASEERKQFEEISLDKYIPNPGANFNKIPGMYTDDTQMSIGVTELLASDKSFTRENLADFFVNCYKRDPINGYARRFQGFLESIASGTEFLKKIKPYSERNGAAMRSVPIGLMEDAEKVVEYATINASLTHNTPKGIASSVAVALLSHFNFYEKTIQNRISSDLISEVRKADEETATHLSDIMEMKEFDPVLLFGEKNKNKGVPCNGMRTAGAVLYLLSNYQNPPEILKKAVQLGGDTDSVASISLGIALMHNDVSELPNFLYEGLTNHKYGRDYLINLGNKLAEKYNIGAC